ncbi:hypothetical protein K2173_007899 [Erythroxylum novogranatense]|uniref:Poly [ADP-ribose] polymerase n=1 Tax=Erythroxylum novogranatense TaxID=1862640 RepID=A0AAV8T6S1_9ROSI|nr:hypothetical protein K2173_007899 [Erythroxylum novogranatense]
MEGECKTAVESPTVRLPARESISATRVNHGSVQLLLQNHANFKFSAAPLRFMYSSGDGKWQDCPGEVVESLKVAFAEGKTIADASIGGVSYLFDLLRMLQLDLESGAHRSIAWIDVKGKCFFPKVCVCEDGDDDLQEPEVQSIKIEVMVDGNSTKAQQMEGVQQEAEVSSTKKEDDNDFEGSKRQDFVNLPEVETSRWPSTRLLPEGEIVFSMYKDFFLSGMRGVDPGVTITAIYQCTRVGPLEKARYEVFEKQTELTRALRGSCNTVYAWHGASAKVVDNILAYGFGVQGKNSAGVEPYRSGILLSPLALPFESAKLAEADSKGEKHVMLCKVILGNVEKVELRSKQFYPSSVHYDNGADDPRNPKWYTVWSSNMNSHIIPECVLSFKLSNSVQGHVRSLTSLRYSLQELCKKIRNLLPPSKCQEVETLYNASKDGKLAKNILIRRLRQVAGDEVLKTAIQELRGLP